MTAEIGYKSYCWVVGTTSYRTDNFNSNIESQLALIDEFRSLPNKRGVAWSGNNDFQKKYYEFLKEKDFLTGDADKPDKDAREKTSGLVDIGLLTKNRELTEVGQALLEISRQGDFKTDNLLEIPKDSFIYFKQMLKTSNKVNQDTVRPFIVFLYVLSKTEYLTNDEFTYLLPLCVNKEVTDAVIEEILSSRDIGTNYDQIIWDVLKNMPNYVQALGLLQRKEVTEDLICTIGINRKSKQYDKPYYVLYQVLRDIVFDYDNKTRELYDATKRFSNAKIAGSWRKLLFNTRTRGTIIKNGRDSFNDIDIFQSSNIDEFNYQFFKAMHIIKAKATLSDYFDLNRRYFGVTDTVIFEDDRVKLDVLPGCYVQNISEHLETLAFEGCSNLEVNLELEKIDQRLEMNEGALYETLGLALGVDVENAESARTIIQDERYARFNKLVNDKFGKEAIIRLFSDFENRNDDQIRDMVTDNADIPTIFEYILGIAWYYISERQGKVLDFMNLSLDANLLPKTHAGGGEADIVWEYAGTDSYPEHTLLLEATLAERTNQRRMEMEPVSRHLGDYCLSHPETEAYCVFVTTYLDINVISDFRNRRFTVYYNTQDPEDLIEGMKIMPIQTDVLKDLLVNNAKYKDVFNLFEKAYNATENPREWYENNIVKEVPHSGNYQV